MEHLDQSIAQLASAARPSGLIAEVERYLDAVAAFRELGHEPSWRAEMPSVLVLRVPGMVRAA